MYKSKIGIETIQCVQLAQGRQSGLYNTNKRGEYMKKETFSIMEKDIFNAMCIAAQDVTRDKLEKLDIEIAKARNPQIYRLKAIKETSVKTVYGDVRYKRRMYIDEAGHARYLLDEILKIRQCGQYSENLVEKMLITVTQESYRAAAQQLAETTGEILSHTAIWNVVNKVGKEISDMEKSAPEEEYNENKKDVRVLFEEMDGVWLPMQGNDHKKIKKQELKVATIYDGWDAETGKHLVNRLLVAGMEPAGKFLKKKENAIAKAYNIDEIEHRILNADGGRWIKDDADNVIFQLDRFHILQEITRKINKDKNAAKDITRLFRDEKIDEMLEYITVYADSIDNDNPKDDRAQKARELYGYLNNNKDGLLPYNSRKRNIKLPEPPEGIQYKGMGVQENQNCSLITLRMKHGRMRWSVAGGNAIAKILTSKANGTLHDIVCNNVCTNTEKKSSVKDLSAADIPQRIGDKNYYPDLITKSMPILQGALDSGLRAIKSFCTA